MSAAARNNSRGKGSRRGSAASRPAGRTGGSAARSGARPGTPPRQAAGRGGQYARGAARESVPLPATVDPGRARAIVGGLLVFVAGFAVAGALAFADAIATPPYIAALVIGVLGVAVTAYAVIKAGPELSHTPIWSRPMLRLLSTSAGLPPVVVMAAFYGLAAFAAVGVLLVPAIRNS